jgi:hypothetical protein
MHKAEEKIFGIENAHLIAQSIKLENYPLKTKLFALALIVSAFALTPFAKADSITLASHAGDTYTYDLTLDNYLTGFLFSGFQLTGLSGVTDASLSGNLASHFQYLNFDSNSVTVGTLATLEGSWTIPFSVGTLTVISADTPGNVDFAILDSNGLSTGQVLGPDSSPVPEPSSLVLLGSGLIAAAGVARRKLFA